MDSSSKVQVYMSGFGPFMGVPHNPTEMLVKEIQTDKTKYEQPSFEFTQLAVAEVSDKGSSETVDKFYSHIKERGEDGKKSLVIHLGVHSGAKAINVEQCAYNLKNYDDQGYQAPNQQITTDMDLDKSLSSDLSSKTLCEKCSSDVFQESDNPGRYLCNNIYFKSLNSIQKDLKVPCLFLHMPPFEVFDQETQLKHLNEMVATVCSSL